MTEKLSADDARRVYLRAQGLLGAPDKKAGVPGVLRRVGTVQLDTISVLARSHELVAYARLGPVGRKAVEHAYWSLPAQAFEFRAHAMSILPIEEWPWFAARRRWCKTSKYYRNVKGKTYDEIRARLAAGPATATELGGAKRGGVWWDWSDAKMAVETLLQRGDVVCVERRGWKRVYDLPERVIPAELLAHEPDDDECYVHLVAKSLRHLGVATRSDIADYYRLKMAAVDRALPEAGGVPVEVHGWDEPAWADPAALGVLGERGRHRTTMLSPFDSLVWDRHRTERMFGMYHRLEAYVPKDKRVHGYFAMPVLAGGRIVARVDPKREGKTLVAKNVTLVAKPSDRVAADVAEALREAAAWVGSESVVVERSELPIPI